MNNKQLIRKVIVFLGVLLLLHAGFYLLFYKLLPVQQNKRYRLDTTFGNLQDTVDFLFIGNSHVNRGVETDSIPRSFKFHGPTETAPYFYYRMKYILEHEPGKVKAFVIPAELGLAAFNPQPILFMGDYWKRYIDFSELASYSDRPMYYQGIGWKLKWVPYYQFPAALLFGYDLQQERNQYKQYLKESWDQYDSVMRDTILQYMLSRHELIDALTTETGLHYVQKLSELSTLYQVPIFAVKWPLTPVYRQGVAELGFIGVRDAAIIDSLLSAGPYVRILDFETLYDGQDSLFFDPHHLSKQGKAAFSVLLRDTLGVLLHEFYPE